MIIIDGKKIAQEVQTRLKRDLRGREIGLAAVLVGENEGLKKFVAIKKKFAQVIGVQFSTYAIEEDVSEERIRKTMSPHLGF